MADLFGSLELGLRDIFENATRAEMLKAGSKFLKIVNAYRVNVTDPIDIAAANSELADLASVAIVEAYKTNVLDVRSAPPYRTGDRLSGSLLSALETGPIAFGDQDGIVIGNPTLLDAVARHWRRLNFGAAPGEGHAGEGFAAVSARIQFGQNQGFSFAFTGPMSAAFRTPEQPAFSGHFNEQGQFFVGYPTKEQRQSGGEFAIVRNDTSRGFSKGIAPRNFMNAGALAVAKDFKRVYLKFFQDAALRAKEAE